MRVTAETRAATRERILEVARHLLTAQGFQATTTRDIARSAGIAVGTVFNYFPTKEAIVANLASQAVADAQREFIRSARDEASLNEALFALMAAELRKLKPLRRHLPVLFETVLSPLTSGAEPDAQRLRVAHLELVAQLCRQHSGAEASSVALQLYWSLYAGVLHFWAGDNSPRQEDTLALLDSSLEMFVGWLERCAGAAKKKTGEKED